MERRTELPLIQRIHQLMELLDPILLTCLRIHRLKPTVVALSLTRSLLRLNDRLRTTDQQARILCTPKIYAASHALDHGAIPPAHAGHYQGQYGEPTARGSDVRVGLVWWSLLLLNFPRASHTSTSSFYIAAFSLLLYVCPTQFIQCQTTNA